MSRRTVQALILAVAAFLLATAVAWGVFGAMPQLEDEHANYFQARVFASLHVTAPAPRVHPEAFFIPFIINDQGRLFGKYPPGYPLLLTAGVLIGQPWIINALAAAVAVFGVYLLGRDLFNADTGLLAAALGAISPMFVLLNGSLLAHTTTLAELTIFAWAFVRARRSVERHRASLAALAGATIGWALITRPWTAVAIGAPFALLALRDLFDHPRLHVRIYGLMLIVALAVASILPIYNTLATGSPVTNTYRLWWPYDSIGFGPGTGRGDDGHTLDKARLNFELDFPDLGVTLFGWPVLAGFALSWLPVLLGIFVAPHDRRDWLLLLLPVLLIIAHLAYWARGDSLYGPRYYAEGLPFLWIVAARGLIKVSAARWPRRLIFVALPLFIVFSAVFVIEPRFIEGFDRYARLRVDVDRIDAAHLQQALVFVRANYWTDYASLAWQNAPGLDASPVLFAYDYGPVINEAIRQAYPGRRVYYYDRTQSVPLVAGRE
jgi:4-amino-4-deoxy-L-arabinose transferase-like glycosyltransferase